MTNVEKRKSSRIACDVCLKEIPISEAKIAEATDYVAHFCGLECFEQWKKKGGRDKGQVKKA